MVPIASGERAWASQVWSSVGQSFQNLARTYNVDPATISERAPPHSRTSFARATNTSDKETSSNAAVLRLTAM